MLPAPALANQHPGLSHVAAPRPPWRKHERTPACPASPQAQHSDFLEVIIIVLICVDVVILLATLAATLGLIGGGGGEGGGGHDPARHVHSLGGLMAYVVSRVQG